MQYVREQRSGGVAGYWVDDKHFVGNVGYRYAIQRADGVATPVHTVARTKQAIENLCVSVAVIALLDRQQLWFIPFTPVPALEWCGGQGSRR